MLRYIQNRETYAILCSKYFVNIFFQLYRVKIFRKEFKFMASEELKLTTRLLDFNVSNL